MQCEHCGKEPASSAGTARGDVAFCDDQCRALAEKTRGAAAKSARIANGRWMVQLSILALFGGAFATMGIDAATYGQLFSPRYTRLGFAIVLSGLTYAGSSLARSATALLALILALFCGLDAYVMEDHLSPLRWLVCASQAGAGLVLLGSNDVRAFIAAQRDGRRMRAVQRAQQPAAQQPAAQQAPEPTDESAAEPAFAETRPSLWELRVDDARAASLLARAAEGTDFSAPMRVPTTGAPVALVVPKLSTVPVRVRVDAAGLSLGIFPCTSSETLVAAIEVSALLAELTAQPVRCGQEPPLSPSELCARHDRAWADAFERESAASVIAHANRTPVRIEGVRRPMIVGPRMLAALSSHADGGAHELIARFRLLNYLEEADVYVGNSIVIQEQTPQPGRQPRTLDIGVYGEGVATVLCVATIAVRADARRQLFVAPDTLARQLGEQARWLGDEALLLPSLSGEAWTTLVAGIEKVARTNPFEA